MKKAIIITCIAGFGLFALAQSGLLESLLLFLLVGAVPGTDYSIPSHVMLLAIIGIVWLIVVRFMAVELFYSYMDKRAKEQKTVHKKRMPKRRFSQI
jgi:arginine exporter protein ArgO